MYDPRSAAPHPCVSDHRLPWQVRLLGGLVLIAVLASCLFGTPAPTAQPTAPPTTAASPTRTLTTAERARALAEAGVTANAQWTPTIERINNVQMALVPAGCFPMGTAEGQPAAAPVHEVCFTEPFWIDVYEVTNGGSLGPTEECAMWSSEPEQPRICIRWDQAMAHCDARGIRLPTEAEWEYAARGPDGLRYPWGDEFDPDRVVYADNAPAVLPAVGSRSVGASWVGAQDLSGSVFEWVSDWYDETYYARVPDGALSPQGPASGEARVVRGGSWVNPGFGLLSSYRIGEPPNTNSGDIGFRCAMAYQ